MFFGVDAVCVCVCVCVCVREFCYRCLEAYAASVLRVDYVHIIITSTLKKKAVFFSETSATNLIFTSVQHPKNRINFDVNRYRSLI